MRTSEDVIAECVIKSFEETVKRIYPNAENFRHTEENGLIANLFCEVKSEHVTEFINHNPNDYSWSVHRETAGGSYDGYSTFSLELALARATKNSHWCIT
jgi:hypothetical protein